MKRARSLIDSTGTSTLVGLRDRAVIALMTYAFARVGAVIRMRVEDVYVQDRRAWLRLHEKGGKRHEMPAHHKLESYLHEYMKRAGREERRRPFCFRQRGGARASSRLIR